jgi:BirA family biotin operon repressor/biotin-[acetyl-CoA-carboxylase] ligase
MPKSDPGFMPATAIGAPLDVIKVQEQLAARRLGAKLHHFAEVGSTNTCARELAERGAAEGEVVIAETQTQGRGRLGRHWESPALVNLYLSIILRPTLAPAHAPQITLMAAVALVETLAPLIAQAPMIKWPNDILVNGKKLAGVLTEAACSADVIEHVILGIGINVNYRVSSMPPEIRSRATSIAELTRGNVDRETVLVRLIQALDRCYGELEESGFDALRRLWEAHFGWRGQRVKVQHLDQVFTGRARGIEQDGALVLEDDHGVLHSIYAGDVIPLET